MAFKLDNNSPSSVPRALAEINVTPFVDVMLVLLIVFMISAPLMQQGLQVELPQANAGAIDETPEQVTIIVKKPNKVFLNGQVIPQGSLGEKLLAIASAKPNVQLFVQADKDIPYGFIAQVIAEAKKAKIEKVGLVTQPADPNFKL